MVFAFLTGHLPFIPYSMTLEGYPARTLSLVHCRTRHYRPNEAGINAPAFTKNYPHKRTIDTISPVITHDKQPENPCHEILQDINTADRKKREYPVLRPKSNDQCRNFT
jgi:hypothetical protein